MALRLLHIARSSRDNARSVKVNDYACNIVCRGVFSGISRPPSELHFGDAPYSPRFTLTSSQDLDVKRLPNIFTHSLHHRKRKGVAETPLRACPFSDRLREALGTHVSYWLDLPGASTIPLECAARQSSDTDLRRGSDPPPPFFPPRRGKKRLGLAFERPRRRFGRAAVADNCSVVTCVSDKKKAKKGNERGTDSYSRVRVRENGSCRWETRWTTVCRRPEDDTSPRALYGFHQACLWAARNSPRLGDPDLLHEATRVAAAPTRSLSMGLILQLIRRIGWSKGDRGELVVRLLASHLGKTGSIPGGVASPPPHPTVFRMWESCRTMVLVGGFSRGSPVSSRPCIPTLLHTHLTSPASALKTSDVAEEIYSHFFTLLYKTSYFRICECNRDVICFSFYHLVTANVAAGGIEKREKVIFMPTCAGRFKLSGIGVAFSLDGGIVVVVVCVRGRREGWFLEAGDGRGKDPPHATPWLDFSPSAGFDSRRGHSDFSHAPAGFLRDLPFLPPFRSGAAPHSPHFTSVGSQDVEIKSCAEISPLHTVVFL
ncbi:hypothetical protein PR048_033446 [Dryococelus australis]|uniref:Uncharacterized protein n=1 Tax=Dryococelus australis TaxID=614101 RepID=A0ABQ9G179_9NEOP|nr:hypothetical protein PR048_033446 [Dryococelus australis]